MTLIASFCDGRSLPLNLMRGRQLSEDAATLLLEVVSSKTGYPVNMLDLTHIARRNPSVMTCCATPVCNSIAMAIITVELC